MEKENPIRKALMGLPLWAKALLCLLDIVYGIERIVEAALKKNTVAIVVAVVWLFVYPVNLIVDLILIILRGRWFSAADLIPDGEGGGAKKEAVEAEYKEKDRN